MLMLKVPELEIRSLPTISFPQRRSAAFPGVPPRPLTVTMPDAIEIGRFTISFAGMGRGRSKLLMPPVSSVLKVIRGALHWFGSITQSGVPGSWPWMYAVKAPKIFVVACPRGEVHADAGIGSEM